MDDFDEGRRWKMWKMCPTEIWMCIKLLVDMDTSLKIIDEIIYTYRKKLYENAACSNTKKNLYWDLRYTLVNFGFTPWGSLQELLGFCDGECSRATNDLWIWIKH